MSIWNKILLGCIFVTALVLFVLSTRALQAHRIWQKSYNEHELAIAETQQQAKDLGEGDEGLRETKLQLYKLLIGRGRVWSDCRLAANPPIEEATDPVTKRERVQITLNTPDPIEAKSVLYAFEDKPLGEGGTYLGQFTVTQVGNGKVGMEPSLRLSDAELARIQASQQTQTPWRLYELMPTDDHDVLDDLTEEQKKVLFPNEETFTDAKYSSINDYLYHGQIIMKEESERLGLHGKVVMVDESGKPVLEEAGERKGLYKEVEDGKGMFIRTLRDYELLFDEEHRVRAMTEDRIQIAKRDLQFLEEALADSRIQRQTRQKEIRDLEQDLVKVSQERDSVQDLEAKLSGAIASMKRAIDDLIARNDAGMAQVGQIQAEAAQVINARTAGVVQSSNRPSAGP